jgi:hypothetical protein
VSDDVALWLANDLKHQLAELVRTIVDAVNDGKVSPIEGLLLGTRALTFASAVLALLQSTDAATRQRVLDVLEHGVLVLPDSTIVAGGPA